MTHWTNCVLLYAGWFVIWKMQQSNDAGKKGYHMSLCRYVNSDTRKQLLTRAKFILTRHESKWTTSERWRADIIFEFYPEFKQAYQLAMELTDI